MKKIMVLCAALGLIVIWGYVESLNVRVVYMDLENDRLSEILAGKTVVHISDIHMDSRGYRENKMMSLIEQLKPDMVFLTGDFIPWRGDVHAALEFFSGLSAPLGTYAVMGDYDYSNSRNSCLFCHQKGTGLPTTTHHIRMMRNEILGIETEAGAFQLAGFDGAYDSGLMPGDLGKTMDQTVPLIVLAHDPLQFDELDENLGCIMLAGDTHGGQLHLPSVLWPLLGYEKNARYNHGTYKKGANRLFVTRGVGTSHVPFRLFCPPEIVVIRFRGKEDV